MSYFSQEAIITKTIRVVITLHSMGALKGWQVTCPLAVSGKGFTRNRREDDGLSQANADFERSPIHFSVAQLFIS